MMSLISELRVPTCTKVTETADQLIFNLNLSKYLHFKFPIFVWDKVVFCICKVFYILYCMYFVK